jgi:DNA-binding CsgD family transcriptional regulator
MTFDLRRQQDRMGDLLPVMKLISASSSDAAWLPGLACLQAEVGLIEEATAALDRLCEGVGRSGLLVPPDHLFQVSLGYVADAAVATNHPIARQVYELLSPWAGRGVWAAGLALHGSADRFLGRLAATMGDRSRAIVHLETAIRTEGSSGWATWSSHSELALAEVLMRPGGSSADLERAGRLIETARERGRKLGLPVVVRRSTELSTQLTPSSSELTTRELDVLGLVDRGLTNRQIGEQLQISQHTVANQVRSILSKTRTTNRGEAAAWARDRSLLDDRPD